MCTKPTSGHNLAFLIWAYSSGRALTRTTCPNDFTWAPARPKQTDKGEPSKRAPRTCTKPIVSQLSIFDTGSFAWVCPRLNDAPNELTRTPSNDPPERFYMGTRMTQTNRQGRVGQMSCTNVHKANLGSQLSIFNTGRFTRACPCLNDSPERVDIDALK